MTCKLSRQVNKESCWIEVIVLTLSLCVKFIYQGMKYVKETLQVYVTTIKENRSHRFERWKGRRT